MAPFFLDSIPKEELDSLLRFFSRIPNASNWEVHIDVMELLELFAVRGALGGLMKSRFNMLCISSAKHRYRFAQNCYLGRKLRHEPHLWAESISVARDFILRGGGESLRTLVVERDRPDLIEAIMSHCPNVTSLSIDERRSSWADKLEIGTSIKLQFPPHSTTPRELILTHFWEHLNFADLWRRIGCSLEKLVVYKFPLRENEVRHSEHGDQLECGFLFDMNERQMKAVFDACPNARFYLEKWEEDFSLAELNINGPRLDAISKGRFRISGDYIQWMETWEK